MDKELQEKLEDACWAAHTLFNRNKATGSSANMSFVHQGHIFITASGTCFGRLKPEDFAELDMEGNLIAGRKASKEFPLHQGFYKKSANIGAVIHTHSYYGTLLRKVMLFCWLIMDLWCLARVYWTHFMVWKSWRKAVGLPGKQRAGLKSLKR